MKALRKLARDRECQVRLPNVCNRDPATTVLAHLRLIGVSGLGIKANDLFGAWCCSSCHQWCDTHHDDESKLLFYQGIFRTQNALLREGIL